MAIQYVNPIFWKFPWIQAVGGEEIKRRAVAKQFFQKSVAEIISKCNRYGKKLG
jgi:hypothetical protein